MRERMEDHTIPTVMTEFTPDHQRSKKELFVFEDYNQRIVIAVILCLVILVGTIGNTLVIIAVVVSRKLRSSTNWFIVHLGCTDLLSCLTFPFNVIAVLSRDGWPLPGWICSTSSALFLICLGASVMTLALIAYNRWYLLTQPMAHFQKLYTTRKICFMLLSAWMYPSVLVLVPYFAGMGKLGYSYEYKSCSQDTSLPLSDLYSLIAGACVIIPIFIAMIVIYVRIYFFVSRHSKKMELKKPAVSKTRVVEDIISVEMGSLKISSAKTSTTSETPSHVTDGALQPGDIIEATAEDITPMNKNIPRNTADARSETPPLSLSRSSKFLGALSQNPTSTAPPRVNRYHVTVTKRLAIVVIAFFICMLPFGISVCVPPSDPGIPWTGLLMTINSCLNPLIYARTMPEFRKVMWAIIRCRLQEIPEPISCIRRLR